MKRVVALVLVCAVLIVTLGSVAFASGDIMPRYDYTSNIRASLNITGGTATATGSITPDYSYRTSVTVRLQRNDDGQWNTIKTWRGSNSGGCSSAGGTKTVASGYTYRTFVTGYVYNSDGVVIEVVSLKSAEKSY